MLKPTSSQVLPPAPSELFLGLFQAVWEAKLFPDVKQWADAVYRAPPEIIITAYVTEKPTSATALKQFVDRFFDVPPLIDPAAGGSDRCGACPLADHLSRAWQQLIRQSDCNANDSLLPLRRPYVVPGGIFREIYYWDSYFTCLGLIDQHPQLVRDMAANLSDLIDRFGFIPNGNRTYYLTRSQPPFFHALVRLVVERDPQAQFADFLPQLEREYSFWMDGAPFDAGGAVASERSIVMPDGARLNRYWDTSTNPRDEAYRQDVATAVGLSNPTQIYRNIRAAAESGWDFSSRWFADQTTLATVETTSVVPIDLNAVLFGLEMTLAEACVSVGRPEHAATYIKAAHQRRTAAEGYLWCDAGYFSDFNLRTQSVSSQLTAATIYPLFFGMASQVQADQVAAVIESNLLAQGGIVTTLRTTGEQWDSPNGWAPIQWLAVMGLERYGHHALAKRVAKSWVETVSRVYSETGKMLEKYDVVSIAPGGGGEYPLQDGFGWTNGVTIALLEKFPELRCSTDDAAASPN